MPAEKPGEHRRFCLDLRLKRVGNQALSAKSQPAMQPLRSLMRRQHKRRRGRRKT